jgi:hypothetical protein
MNTIRVALSRISKNMKTGPIPVSTSGKSSCPKICPMRNNGCYADHGAINVHWNRLEKKTDNGYAWGMDWNTFCDQVSGLPSGSVWRHNQAGDLPSLDDGRTIDRDAMARLIIANNGKMGFTYTHHDMRSWVNREIVKDSNNNGFIINLSANNLKQADTLINMGIGPVVVIQNAANGTRADTETPDGHRVVTCPATYKDGVTCLSCRLCARNRDIIVGFPAHGIRQGIVRKMAGKA